MKTIDLNFKLKTITGVEIEDYENAAKYVGQMLSLKAQEFNPITAFEIASSFYKTGKATLTSVDCDKLSRFILEHNEMLVFVKAAILKAISDTKEDEAAA